MKLQNLAYMQLLIIILSASLIKGDDNNVMPMAQESSSVQAAPCIVQQTSNKELTEDEREMAIVLSGFAHIVNNFIKIIQNPHNTENVAQGVGGIVCNIGSIISEAIRAKIECVRAKRYYAQALHEARMYYAWKELHRRMFAQKKCLNRSKAIKRELQDLCGL